MSIGRNTERRYIGLSAADRIEIHKYHDNVLITFHFNIEIFKKRYRDIKKCQNNYNRLLVMFAVAAFVKASNK